MRLLCVMCYLLIVMQSIIAFQNVLGDDVSNCEVTGLDPISLDQCGGTGYAIRCINASLKHVPMNYTDLQPHNQGPFCLLDLNVNLISHLDNYVFRKANVTQIKVLFLAENSISKIDSNAFDGLSSLMYLNLSKNHLIWPSSFGNNVFKPLTNLITLNLKVNNFTTFDGLDREMSHLKSLVNLFINACSFCVFGKGFNELPKLINMSLSGREENDCNMSVVSNETFTYMTSLKHLYMSSCNIKSIEPDAFAPLVNISLLDISYNTDLNFTGMNIALYGLRNSSTLKTLNVNCLHGLYEMGTEVRVEHLQNLKTLRNLQVLKMDLNKIEVFQKEIFTTDQLPSTLEFVTLSSNRINYGEYVQHIHLLQNVYFVDISRQNTVFDPYRNQHFPENEYSLDGKHERKIVSALNQHHIELSSPIKPIIQEDGAIYRPNNSQRKTAEDSQCNCNRNLATKCQRMFLPKTLKVLKWRESYIHSVVIPLIICGPTNLTRIELSFNVIDKWIGPVLGVSNVTYLDMSLNNCQNMKADFFQTFYSLEFLNVSSNSLGLQPFTNRTFQNLSKLQHLDLSHNKINKLPSHIFSSLKGLQKLYLTGNTLNKWKPSLKNCKCLELLNLSSNKLETLPEIFRTDIDSLTVTSCSNRSIIRIDLSHNTIKCTCENLKFLNWVNHAKYFRVEFSELEKCTLPDGTTQRLINVSTIVLQLEKQCAKQRDYQALITTCVVILSSFITAILCALSFKNRWKLRFIYYSRNRRFIHKGYERMFEFDAFVSYASEDASFIKHKLVPELENRHGLKLWVADRNSMAGSSIAQNITHAIYNSKKSIILLNRRYCHESWCDYELNMAHTESIETKRKLMIIVFMEDVPPKTLPIDILRLLRNETTMEYPQHPQHVEVFWSNLAEMVIS